MRRNCKMLFSGFPKSRACAIRRADSSSATLVRRYRCGLAGLREYFRLPERSPPLEESSSVIIEHPASARREPVSGKPRASRCSNLREQDNGERYTCCVFYVARTCRAARLASRPDSGLEYSLRTAPSPSGDPIYGLGDTKHREKRLPPAGRVLWRLK